MVIGYSERRKADKYGKADTDYRAIVSLLLIVCVASVPLMTDYVLQGSNLQASLSRIEAVRQGIGHAFPIRIGPWNSLDYGHGAASFQADVFFLVPALLRILGFSVGSAYKWSLFLANVCTAVIAFWSFKRCFGRRETALAGSMLYTWCPCRLNEMYIEGNLGNIAAWTFLPLLISGLVRLYCPDGAQEREDKEYDRLWVTLTWAFSLLALSSTSIFLVSVGMSAILFLFMGKRSWKKRTLIIVGRTVCAVLLVNAWFLIPMLLRMRDAMTVGILIPGDFQSFGMYFAQYVSVFLWGGDSTQLFEKGMTDAQAMGPGAAVMLLVLLYVWTWYMGKQQDTKERELFGRRMLGVALLLVFLSSSFPWDLLQNKNMLFSILLALLQTPVRWGIPASVSLLVIACLALDGQTEREKEYRILLLLTAAVSFGTTQFLLGNILKTRAYVEDYTLLPLQVIGQESVLWRLCEAVSAVALCGCLVMSIVRRRKGVKKV